MANSSINLIDLDFFALKSDIKNYLKNQTQFKDYDFEGSSMSVLIDQLAHNTFKNTFYTNMLFAESFLDSAQLRSSVVSHAKELGYTPRSKRSSKARIRVDFQADGTNQPYIISKGQTVSGLVRSSNFTFSIPETLTVSSSNTTFSFETDIYEGVYLKDTYIYNQLDDEVPTFRIKNKNIDTSSLSVVVYEDGSTEGQVYTKTEKLLDLNFESKVFFIQCDQNEYYEIYFGDGILGKKPKNNSTIVLDYRIASGKDSDGVLSFTLNFNPTGSTGELLAPYDISTVEVSKGGADVESIESIKYYAPKAYQTQERAVTSLDYKTSLKTQFPEINAVYSYGGEEATPPRYGRVFVAVDISDVDGFPESKKREYYNFIKNRSPYGIEPIFIEPEYSYLSINSKVRYNVNITKVNQETIKTLIINSIITFKEKYLDDFAVTFRNSKLAKAIDDTDTSIISSILDVEVYKKVDLTPGTSTDIKLNFNMALKDDIPAKASVHDSNELHTLTSSPFRLNGQTCIFEDDGAGKIRLVSTDGKTDSRIYDVGSINYDTGEAILKNIRIDTFIGSAIKFYVKPRDLDITATKNTILTVEDSEIIIDIEALRE